MVAPGEPREHAPGHDGHGHHHAPSLARANERNQKRLALAFFLTLGFFVIELVAGIATNSLALLSDAGHMVTDVIALGMAWAAISIAARFARHDTSRSPTRHTFGMYRLEILAAFVNALLLFGVAIWVLIESLRRLLSEAPIEVISGPMLLVAVGGLGVNTISFFLLREGAKDSLNLQGAYLEVLADAVGSVGVIVASILVWRFGWTWADPVAAMAIGAWILPRTWRLGANAARILLQSAPKGFDIEELRTRLESLRGVVGVHDLHVWTLTSEMDAASAHLVVTDDADFHAVLDEAHQLFVTRYQIDHGTFQVEPESHTVCQDLTW